MKFYRSTVTHEQHFPFINLRVRTSQNRYSRFLSLCHDLEEVLLRLNIGLDQLSTIFQYYCHVCC
jgi:hypothetical protein